ncbi:hypothetical protein NPIL_546091 [Nephila pilipes]|uniref:Uncharacterized protein n=1 Tax=Nephila pilipes TaxID=299642 RepID=A0A8X6TDR6_NEPPI|nr:hypothetical protein NPIL_546091 [Nephila pilipes]
MVSYKLSSDKLSSISRSYFSNTTKCHIMSYHSQGQTTTQPHIYQSFGQNRNQGDREISEPTCHYDHCSYDDFIDQQSKNIGNTETKEDKEKY